MLKKTLYLSLIVIACVGLNACSEKSEITNEPHENPVEVTLSVASAGSRPVILASGLVEAVRTANISTRVMGRITNVYVKTGDRVHKGQLLATVWDEDLKAKRAQADAMIAEAESAFANAQKDYDRFNNLYKQQSATAKELDNVRLQYNSANARVSASKQVRSEVNANLSYGSLTAPFAGIVTQKLAEVGSIANPGMPIVTIEQDGAFQVSATIAESDISYIHLDDVATIQLKSTGRMFEGKIIQVNPSSQFTGGQYVVKISIPETASKDIYSGMFANISIAVKNEPQAKSNVLLVPSSAIINRDGLNGIYTVSANNTALLRWLRLGKNYGDKVEVLSGLSKEETFIISSASRLNNGVPVVVIQGREMSVAADSDSLSFTKRQYRYVDDPTRYE